MIKKIAIIAGENSGDSLGASLMQYINHHYTNVTFIGIGGDRMQAEGLVSLFPYDELNKLGLIEILPYIFKAKKRIKETAAYFLEEKPDLFLSIDSPTFTKRVAIELKTLSIPLFHWVAPTVWAWRPKRRFTYAKIFDRLFCLFPFEKKYFADTSLDVVFSGHPLADYPWDTIQDLPPAILGESQKENCVLLLLLPGSRLQEIKRHLPIMLLAAHEALQTNLADKISIMVPKKTRPLIESYCASWGDAISIVSEDHKYSLLKRADFAIASSGTVILECAFTKTPTIICYKLHSITMFILKKLAMTKFVSLINILAMERIMEELLQKEMTARNIVHSLKKMRYNEHISSHTERLFDVAMTIKAPQGQTSYKIVGESIAKEIDLMKKEGKEDD